MDIYTFICDIQYMCSIYVSPVNADWRNCTSVLDFLMDLILLIYFNVETNHLWHAPGLYLYYLKGNVQYLELWFNHTVLPICGLWNLRSLMSTNMSLTRSLAFMRCRILRSSGDGHCLLYRLVSSWSNQLPVFTNRPRACEVTHIHRNCTKCRPIFAIPTAHQPSLHVYRYKILPYQQTL